MDGLTAGCWRCATVDTTRQAHLLYWFSFCILTGRTDYHLLTTIIVVRQHSLMSLMGDCSAPPPFLLRTVVTRALRITCMSQLNRGLSHNAVAATIRGNCRHFTAQWRESAAHASGHKYGGSTNTHTNKSIHVYVNAYTQRRRRLTDDGLHRGCTSKHTLGLIVGHIWSSFIVFRRF